MNLSPWLYAVIALAIGSTLAMDLAGLSMLSAFTLLALIGLHWLVTRHSWRDWGMRWGRPADYGLALAYPLFVMGILAVLLILSGADLSDSNWRDAATGFLTIGLATIPGAYITEEGFFRGSLFAGCKRDGLTLGRTVVLTSVVFSAWHIGWATVSEEGRVSLHILPVYLVNAALLGAAWGLLRALSGSVLVASVSHGIWNGMAYSLFGFGSDGGVIGMESPLWLDPERGLVAIALNSLFVAYLWRRLPKDDRGQTVASDSP